MDAYQIKWILFIGHFLFWFIIIIRILISRLNKFVAKGNQSFDKEVQPSQVGEIKKAWGTLWFFTFSMIGYYIVMFLWYFNPNWVGPLILPLTNQIHLLGIILMLLGIALMTWAYIHLHSFKLLAVIGQDHQLCTEGPYHKIRHPVYSGICFFYLGCFFLTPRLIILLMVGFIFLACYLRGRVEEQSLLQAFGGNYKKYMSNTYAYIPWII